MKAGALQELDETDLWLELLTASNVLKSERVEPLQARQPNSSRSALR